MPLELRHRCAQVDRGQQCGNPGSLTSSTGGSDTWYCAAHFGPFRARNPEVTTPPPDWLGGLVATLTAERKPGPLEWAHRITAAPELYPRYAVAQARAALHLAPLRTPDREAAEERVAIMLEPTTEDWQ